MRPPTRAGVGAAVCATGAHCQVATRWSGADRGARCLAGAQLAHCVVLPEMCAASDVVVMTAVACVAGAS
jgi:hypothetical protein